MDSAALYKYLTDKNKQEDEAIRQDVEDRQRTVDYLEALSTGLGAKARAGADIDFDPSFYNKQRERIGRAGQEDIRARRQAITDAITARKMQQEDVDRARSQKVQDLGMETSKLGLESGQFKLDQERRENDPNSEESKVARNLASQLFPNRDMSGMSAKQINKLLPTIQSAYKIELDKKLRERKLAQADQKAKSATASEFQKETTKARAKDYANTQKSISNYNKNINLIDDALGALVDYSKESIGGTGPLATGFGLKKYISQDLESLDAKLKNINLKNMATTFAGMSKAIDSDAERRAWEATQADIKNDDKTNVKILLGAKSILLKDRAEAEAQRRYVSKYGTLDEGYQSPIDGNVETLVDPNGELRLVSKDQIQQAKKDGLIPLDSYASNLLGESEEGIIKEDITGFGSLSDDELEARIRQLQGGR